MTGLEVGLIIAGFSVGLAAVLGFVVRLNGRQADMQIALTKLETQVSPMWATVQARMSADLHHPDQRYYEMDRLLEELDMLTITAAGRTRLKKLLVARSIDMHKDITESQRKSALAMIPLMDLVVMEAEDIKTNKENP
jgi:hypothetical protein